MKFAKNSIILICLVIFVSGCTFKGHEYKSDMNIINKLNDESLKKVNVLPKSSKVENNYSINLRAAKMISPYGSSFNDYILFSLRKQLKQNDLYNPNSNIKIYTELMKNEVDIMGFTTANYQITSKFVIEKDKKIVYDKLLSIQHDFPSHLLGQIAIERGLSNYPKAIQKLISKFLNDNNAIKVLK